MLGLTSRGGMKISDEYLFGKLEEIGEDLAVVKVRTEGFKEEMDEVKADIKALNTKVDKYQASIKRVEKAKIEQCADGGVMIPRGKLLKYGGIATGGGTVLIIVIQILLEIAKTYLGG